MPWTLDSFIAFLDSLKMDLITSVMTDLIALFAAIAALAIPFTLSSIQMANDRYNSTALVRIFPKISGIEPIVLNINLFLFLAGILVLKVELALVQGNHGITSLLVTLMIFLGLWHLTQVCRHIHFVYLISADPIGIKQRLVNLIDKQLIVDRGGYTKQRQLHIPDSQFETLVRAAVEMEAYEFRINRHKYNTDIILVRLVCDAIEDPTERNFLFVDVYLNTFPHVVESVLKYRNSDIYINVISAYQRIALDALLKSKRERITDVFFNHQQIERYQEPKLNPSHRFIANGTIFLSVVKTPELPILKELYSHYKILINDAIRRHLDCIPELVSNINQANSFLYTDAIDWYLPEKMSELYMAPNMDTLAKLVEESTQTLNFYTVLSSRLTTEYKPQLVDFIQQLGNADEKLEEFQQLFDKYLSKLAAYEFILDVRATTLTALGDAALTRPDIVLTVKDKLRRWGYGNGLLRGIPLPTNIDECIRFLLIEKLFGEQHHFWGSEVMHIIRTLSVIIVAEIWQAYAYTRQLGLHAVDLIEKINIPAGTISQYRRLVDLKRVRVLQRECLILIESTVLRSHLYMTDGDRDLIIEKISELCMRLEARFKEAIDSKIRTDPIANEQKEKLYEKFRNNLDNTWDNLFIFKQYSVEPTSRQRFENSYPREAFLMHTGVDYGFNELALIASNYHNDIATGLLLNHENRAEFKALIDGSLPIQAPPNGTLLLSRSKRKTLYEAGFRFDNKARTIIWPGGTRTMDFYDVLGDFNWVLILPKDEPVVTIGEPETTISDTDLAQIGNYPVYVQLEDKDAKVRVLIDFYVQPLDMYTNH